MRGVIRVEWGVRYRTDAGAGAGRGPWVVVVEVQVVVKILAALEKKLCASAGAFRANHTPPFSLAPLPPACAFPRRLTVMRWTVSAWGERQRGHSRIGLTNPSLVSF
jgi:hypothetical protein